MSYDATTGTPSTTGWPGHTRIVSTPVLVVRCNLPHTCPECGCSWGPPDPPDPESEAAAVPSPLTDADPDDEDSGWDDGRS